MTEATDADAERLRSRLQDGVTDATDVVALLARVPCHVYTADLGEVDGVYDEVTTGPGIEWFLGCEVEPGEDPEQLWDSAVHPDDWDAYVYGDPKLRAGQPVTATYRMIGRDGVVRWVRETMLPHPELVDGRRRIDGLIVDVTPEYDRLTQMTGRLDDAERRARIDDLTNLSNRRHFVELLDRHVMRAHLNGDPVAVILVDLDRFKDVNDRYGHLVGDAVLVAAAARLRDAVRPTDVVARWGGEEFVVLLSAVRDGEALRQRAEEVRRVVGATPFRIGTHTVELRLSAGGVCRVPERAGGMALIDEADQAMYAAKQGGRDRVVVGG